MTRLVLITGAAGGLGLGLGRAVTERLFGGPGAEQGVCAQYPLGRYGRAEDAAGAMAWPLSDEAACVTGQVLPVDGGFTAVRPMVKG